MKNFPVILIIAVVIAGAAGFFGGTKYQQTKSSAALSGRQFMTGSAGSGPSRTAGGSVRFGTGTGANRSVTGQIISSDANSITVKLADGSSKIVLVSQSTTINKAASATISDLTSGQTVSAFGTTNADGSVTAQNIQLNPTNVFRGQSATPTP